MILKIKINLCINNNNNNNNSSKIINRCLCNNFGKF